MKRIITQILKKYAFWLILEMLIIALNIYLQTVPSEMVGKIIDLLYNLDANKKQILTTTYWLLGMCGLVLISRVLWRMINAKLEREILKIMRDKLYKKMLKTKVSKLQEIKNGEIMSYFVKDLREIRKLFSNLIPSIFRFVFNMCIVAIVMVRSTNVKLTAIVFIPITCSIIGILLVIRKLEKSYNESRKSFTELSEYVQESTDSIRTTKAYVGEEKQYNEFLKKNKKLKKVNFKIFNEEAILMNITELGLGIAAGISIIFGGKLVLNGTITTGDFIAFNGYLLILANPIRWLPWIIKHSKKAKISYEKLDTFFNLPEEDVFIEDGVSGEILDGNIEIKDLTFKYPGSKENTLENINIKIEKGKSLGIIGVIGSGKTTLMNVLMKLYNVPNNKIFIDGKDINSIDADVIRNNICYITQDNFLFSASLKDNINLFKDVYNKQQLEESTKKSMIYEEIEQMEEGIDTIIGEKGIDLSGGQKQRVVLARAFLNNNNILIFDDTFSALDNRTEGYVLANIIDFTKDKTCIIVSNRISDIKHCDEIVVLENGKIVERGIHSELLKNKFKYYEFYKNQAEKNKVDFLQ